MGKYIVMKDGKERAMVRVEGRITFPSVGKMRFNENKKKDEYQCSVIIDKENTELIEDLKTATRIALAAEFSSDKSKWPAPYCDDEFWTRFVSVLRGKDGVFLRNGSDRKDKQGNPQREYVGKYYISSASDERHPPAILDKDLRATHASEIYSGCYGEMVVNLIAYNNKSQGVLAGLVAVRKLRDGERLGGGLTVADAYDISYAPVEDSSEDDPSNYGSENDL